MNLTTNRTICSLLFVAALLSSPLTLAQEAEEEAVSGAELLADCQQLQPSGDPAHECMKYVFGLVQTVVMLQQMDPSKKLFCIDPTAISLQEVTHKVTGFLKSVPTRLNEDAYVLVSEALNSYYPCSGDDVI